MILDLSDLKEIGSQKNYVKEIEATKIDYRHKEIKLKGPIKVNLDVLKTDRSFVLKGDLECILILQCSRCLKYFDYMIEVEINDELDIEDIDDLHNINIFPLLVSYIIIEIPIKPLHDENCKGLCPICGQNLNEGDCDCEVENIDPRLEKLKEFKQK